MWSLHSCPLLSSLRHNKRRMPAFARYLGIDFSGNFRMWSPGCTRSNVWIAEVDSTPSGLVLQSLGRVQSLQPESEPPFSRLAARLRRRDFVAAAIDAPFSVPVKYLHPRTHRDLLQQVASLPLERGRPFPSGGDLVDFLNCPRQTAKTWRDTEEFWRKRGLNVRPALWNGARPGAPMTAACLKLLWQSECPIWPWQSNGPGLLMEAFPAAQLQHLGLKHQRYDGHNGKENRFTIIAELGEAIRLGKFREKMQASADALDAVICAFAAIAVGEGRPLQPTEISFPEEGQIAIAADPLSSFSTASM
jgi:predicted nuclease with RNAse H fold